MALEGTDVGKVKAAHALAKIAAVSNPDIAFPGERVGVWVVGMEGWEESPLLLGAFLLVILLMAWEGAWCCQREGNKLEALGFQAWLCL